MPARSRGSSRSSDAASVSSSTWPTASVARRVRGESESARSRRAPESRTRSRASLRPTPTRCPCLLPGQAGLDRVAVPPEFDAVSNYRGVTKWAAQANLADRIPTLMRRAFTALRTGRPGPVLLELPADVADAPRRGPRLRAREAASLGPRSGRRRAGCRHVAQSSSPCAPRRSRRASIGAYEELQLFAEQLRLPVATTMGGKSVFREDHALALGAGAVSATAMVARFLEQADLILAVGSSLTNWWMFPPLRPGARSSSAASTSGT